MAYHDDEKSSNSPRCLQYLLPGVHGSKSEGINNNLKPRRRNKLTLYDEKKTNRIHLALWEENVLAYEKQISRVSSHKKTTSAFKDRNFELERENVNLKSQLRALQELCDAIQSQSKVINEIPTSYSDNMGITETRH